MHELFAFLKAYIQFRIETEMGAETVTALPIWKLPKKKKGGEHLVNFLIDHPMSEEEMLVLLLGLIPHVHPGFLSKVISDFFPDGGSFLSSEELKGKIIVGYCQQGRLHCICWREMMSRNECLRSVFSLKIQSYIH